MNVLSLFDGMGCAWIALREAGVKVDNGYSSEIDKFAIMQVEHNFPEVESLGSVTEVDVGKLAPIHLVMGGSPCTNLSFAGKRQGMATAESEEIYTLERYLELKRQGFRFEGQSYLFWEFMRILSDIRKYNPDVLFLLENVEMEKKWERVMSEAIGIRGVHINSALVSAQNRKRIYWTNMRVREDGLFGERYSDIPQPEDRGLLLKDVLEDEVDGKYYLSENTVRALTKRLQRSGFVDLVCVAMRGREADGLPAKNIQQLEPRTDGKCNALTTVAKDSLVLCMEKDVPRQYRVYDTGGKAPAIGASHLGYETRIMVGDEPMIYSRAHGYHKGAIKAMKSPTLTSGALERDNFVISKPFKIRRLTPKECARLQTIPDWYEWVVSDSRQYKMLGNGWTVEVIRHILGFIEK